MSDDFNRISVDDPERDNKITTEAFMRKLCELDSSARKKGLDPKFPLVDLWASFGRAGNLSALDRDTYSRSMLDELRIERSIVQHPDGRIELTEQGRRKYCR